MKRFLIIMQQNPYANSLALEGLELALALCAFNQEVTLLFKGEGVLQLLSRQEADKLVGKDFTKVYTDLNVFGINKVYVEEHSVREYANDSMLLAPEIINLDQIAALIKEHDVVLTI